MDILSSVVVKSNDYIYQLLAFELIFQLRDLLTRLTDFKFDSLIETFIQTNLRLRESSSSSSFSSGAGVYRLDGKSHTIDSSMSSIPPSRSGRELAEFDSLIDFYESKLTQQAEQEAHIMNILNQNFAKSQLKETENRNMRGQLKQFAQKCVDYKAQLDVNEKKRVELESKLGSVTKLQV